VSFLAQAHVLNINYCLSLSAMIALGRYHKVDAPISARAYPIKKTYNTRVPARVVLLSAGVNREQGLSKIRDLGLVPCRIEHLLYFAAIYPKDEWYWPLVALGSVSERGDGYPMCPYICSDGGRCLKESLVQDGWSSACRLLAFEPL
jgi:hypothetical protein